MSNEQIRSILKEVLEEEIPSSQVNLWPAVKADLVAGTHQYLQQGDRMNTVTTRRIPRLALAGSLVLAMLAFLVATPPGRSFAQSVLQLFSRSETFVPPSVNSPAAPTEPDQTSPTAVPPSPLISVVEAEAQVGFNVAEVPYVPEGFDFLGARLYGNNVSLDYQTQGYGHLIIMQSQDGFYQSDWDSVPADAVVPVKIAGLDGEFAEGAYVAIGGQTTGTWSSDASMARLRWVSSGVWFEIGVYGEANHYLDLAGLIELAESLTF